MANHFRFQTRWLPGICLCIGALLSLKLGQDAFWDTKNYHLYNAWALWHGRSLRDVAPAGLQSYFNPSLDLLYFSLATGPLSHWPRVLSAVQGLWFGVLLYVVSKIALRLAAYQQREAGLADVLAVLIGVSGTMAVSQAGSTTNEIPLAILVLLGFYLLMPLFRSASTSHALCNVLLAGLSCGLAAGLKPTAVVYPPALGLALLFAPSMRTNWRLLVVFVLAAAGAFLLGYGWWGWHLYQLTGNPVFPLFNRIFQSDWMAPVDGRDHRFFPHGLIQWLFYPFFWLQRKQGVVVEPAFSDARYALAMLAMLVVGSVKAWRANRLEAKPAPPVVRLFAVFTVTAYVFWLGLFSYLRYAVPLEVLTGLWMLMGVRAVLSVRWRESTVRAWSGIALAIGLMLIAMTTHYPAWGRVRFGERVYAIDTGNVEPGALVLMGGAPSAYLIPFFPHATDLEFIGLGGFMQSTHSYRLWAISQQRVLSHHGAMHVVLRDDDQADLDALHTLLPTASLAGCHGITSNIDTHGDGPRLCQVVRQ